MSSWPVSGTRRFGSTALPPELEVSLVPLLEDAHADDPFVPHQPREGITRAAELVRSLGLEVVTIRGSLLVGGVEVDHVWLAVTDHSGEPWVLDTAFPLHRESFLAVLPGWVAGDASTDDLVAAADGAALLDRVLASFPTGTGYIGGPVWTTGRR